MSEKNVPPAFQPEMKKAEDPPGKADVPVADVPPADVPPAFQPEISRAGDPPGKADVPVAVVPVADGPGPLRISYRRNLPHQVPPGYPIFLTWNLKGALPKHVIEALTAERLRLQQEPIRRKESIRERNIRQSKCLFAKQDRVLDELANESRLTKDPSYPTWLSNPRAAAVVVSSFLWGTPDRYTLYAFVVMSNHIHLLLTPKVELSQITQGIKGWTARQINRSLSRTGMPFWQNESYDHWARDEDEVYRIIQYIEQNPVSAGLCLSPELWPWSSARWRKQLSWNWGEPFPPQAKESVAAAMKETVSFECEGRIK